MISIIEDIGNIKSSRKELREFGITIGVVLLILSGLALWRGKASFPYFGIAGILFVVSGLVVPNILKPLQKIWMALAVVMGFFMSRLILTAIFYGVITPIGVLTRLFGNDVLDQRLCKEKSSYWRDRSTTIKDKESYENQY